ncbi:MAG: tRNA uridine-5-carboxymethylaminomethyl(34) synthesis GTPase MnmE [Alphaproteobacteria bacterium]
MTDTIFALSSAPGRAGVAVLRLSGPAAHGVALSLSNRDALKPRHAHLATLSDPADGAHLDQVILLSFPAPHSFTGEDVVEVHAHGGPATVSALLAVLGQQPGLRLAEPGEFTRRAFHNDRLDLAEAEGLADLIHAETEHQRKQALRQMEGALSQQVEQWRAMLIGALAHIEADIDFSDEDLPDGVADAVRPKIVALHNELTASLASKGGERVRQGISVVVTGPPNAGKSSFINRLIGRDAVIVSAEPGTTRDLVDLHLDLGGAPIILTDTAGIRDADGIVEAEGIRRAQHRVAQADLVLHMVDGANPVQPVLGDGPALVLVSKRDRADGLDNLASGWADELGVPVAALSMKSDDGWDAAVGALENLVQDLTAIGTGDGAVLTRARHRQAVAACAEGLARFLAADGLPEELVAEELRLAMRALGRITGRVDVEDLLDVVFSDFCIGK